MGIRIKAKLRPALADDGLTIVEVLVAALVLTIGAMTTFGLVDAATKNNQRSQATQVALNRAQQELEELRSLPNDELALTSTPPHADDPLNPNYRVDSGNGTFALVRGGASPSEYASLVVNNGTLYGGGYVQGGIVDPGPTAFSSGGVHGKIYRYVAWRNDASCPDATCPGPQDYKQVVVAVKLDTPGNQSGERGYVEVQSSFIDPAHSAMDDPVPGSNGVVTAQQFYLSDTPCSPTGTTARQTIAGDHALHNTLGTCASGMQSGADGDNNGAPDALLLGPPPDPDPLDDSNPPLLDYSSDYSPQPTADTAKGIQVMRDSSAGCHFDPTGSSPQWQTHRWVTDPMPKDYIVSGKDGSTAHITLEIYTRALNDASYTGELCTYLFTRTESGDPPVATDTLLTDADTGNPYWIYKSKGNWPRDKWTSVAVTMTVDAPLTIPAGTRLGLALSVERANTNGDAIPFIYDHPGDLPGDLPTRLEVETSTPLSSG